MFNSVQRPLRVVPHPILLMMVVGLVLQLMLNLTQPADVARASDLPDVPDRRFVEAVAQIEPIGTAKVLNIWLQAFDNQPGVSIPFNNLDYFKITGWLRTILFLDPRGQYPLLAASRIYGEVADRNKQIQMMELVYSEYFEDPVRRWRWLAHAAVMAKHRVKDLSLALKYARALADNAKENQIPPWASQMELVILEDMGELEAARLLIGGLIERGEVTDPKEIGFLSSRLRELEERLGKRK